MGGIEDEIEKNAKDIVELQNAGLDGLPKPIFFNMLQDHHHIDDGHTHRDNGHSHYLDGDPSNNYAPFFGGSESLHDDTLCSSAYHEHCGGWYTRFKNLWTSDNARADISSSTSGIGGATSAQVGGETRPKNMKAVFIMRIF